MSKPKICVCVTAGGCIQAAEVIRSVEPQNPDLIEVRIDYMKTTEGFEEIRGATDLPLIATNRRPDQGGFFKGSEEERVASVLKACEAGFDYVDLELTSSDLHRVVDEVKARAVRLIISHHDLQGTPSKRRMNQILEEEQSFNPDVCKIVGTATSIPDNLTYLNFLMEKSYMGLVSFGMGQQGTLSRVLSPLFGGEFTYASAVTGHESAPGQLTIGTLREIYRLLVV